MGKTKLNEWKRIWLLKVRDCVFVSQKTVCFSLFFKNTLDRTTSCLILQLTVILIIIFKFLSVSMNWSKQCGWQTVSNLISWFMSLSFSSKHRKEDLVRLESKLNLQIPENSKIIKCKEVINGSGKCLHRIYE